MRNLWIGGLVALLLFSGGSSDFFGQEQSGKRFDLALQDAELQYATQMLAQEAGLALQFVFLPSQQPYARITLNLKGVTVDEAVKYICEAAGADFRKDPGNVYVIFPKGTEPKVADAEETKPSAPPPREVVVRKIVLKRQHPKYVLEELFAREADALGEWKAVLRFRDLHAGVYLNKGQDSPVYMNTTPSFTKLESITKGANPPSSDNGIAVPGSDSGVGVSGGSGQGLVGGGGGGGQFGGGGLGGGQFGGGGLGGGAQLQLQGGQGFIPSGIDRIIYDPTDNSLIVQGDDNAIQQLERIIRQLDVAPRQVIIQVQFVTTRQNVSRNFGIDWLFQRGAVFVGNTPGTQARAGDPFFVNWGQGNLTTRLRTLLLESGATIIDAPMVRTLNNQPAFVLQQIATWIILNQLISVGQGQVIVAPTLQQILIQTGLVVQPRINQDGYITLTINPQISQITGRVRGPQGEEAPEITTQTIFVTARVKSGETIVVGGLNHKDEQFSMQRYPILSDLPIIGGLFKSTSKTVNNTELLIFITPTIVPEEES